MNIHEFTLNPRRWHLQRDCSFDYFPYFSAFWDVVIYNPATVLYVSPKYPKFFKGTDLKSKIKSHLYFWLLLSIGSELQAVTR